MNEWDIGKDKSSSAATIRVDRLPQANYLPRALGLLMARFRNVPASVLVLFPSPTTAERLVLTPLTLRTHQVSSSRVERGNLTVAGDRDKGLASSLCLHCLPVPIFPQEVQRARVIWRLCSCLAATREGSLSAHTRPVLLQLGLRMQTSPVKPSLTNYPSGKYRLDAAQLTLWP
jgi:hypothetical protein